ncbi:pyridoxamine 5'-phosphate oxidase family protein [uncultured Clostridium sp.]|uniref:pyridoxamine 5'-phosphate oxidase family protein n=1 Tax=uncultured Clostridium sp. TaxID=59620 RepID=UPI0025FD1435|nr:pyridoxamine 5'-phosphate oxidase family protein [uncultured Clostridium sp.]
MKIQEITNILEKQMLMSLGTYGNKYPDNSIVCFAYNDKAELFFGSYSDTLKCKNIRDNKVVAITIGTLQIHGEAKIVPYGTDEYFKGRQIYDSRFPQYKEMFEQENNELYIIKPYVIWNYNPSKGGEMYRDSLVLNQKYIEEIDIYKPHKYKPRQKSSSY